MIGSVRCKFGFYTGATCGQITSTAAAVVASGYTYLDLVRFDSTDYMVLSYHGDSGGAVMTEPFWNASAGYFDATAAGVLVVGSTRPNGPSPSYPDRPCIMPDDQPCPAYYMAIDRINDFEGVVVTTTTGTVSP